MLQLGSKFRDLQENCGAQSSCVVCQDDWQLPAEAFEPRPEADADEIDDDDDGRGGVLEMSACDDASPTPGDAVTNHWLSHEENHHNGVADIQG